MRLKVKFLQLSAGRPVAVLNEKFAAKAGIHVDERIVLAKNHHKKIIAVVDLASGLLQEDEIAISTEANKHLEVKENEFIRIYPTTRPKSIDIISKKLSGKVLSKEEIHTIIKEIVDNVLTESEIAFFVSSVYNSGMNLKETAEMIRAIVNTGNTLGLTRKDVVDKHSIGGIPGRTTPIVVSICASAGLFMPKTSSRAITTPAGTSDCVEVICKVEFSISEMKKILEKTNACFVWGGSLNLAPADDKIIQIEKLLNLDPESQLLASILSKKLSVNAKYVLIDIPYGENAKVSYEKAKDLEKKFVALSKMFGMKLECFLKEAKEPIGNGIGPSLEIKDVVEVLKNQSSCYKLKEKSLELAGKLLEMTGKAKGKEGIKMAKEILESGKAYEKFKEIVHYQGGSLDYLDNIPQSKFKKDIIAEKSFTIKRIHIKLLNKLARVLGCPTDKFAGIYLNRHLNEKVMKGDILLTLYAESQEELDDGLEYFKLNKPIN